MNKKLFIVGAMCALLGTAPFAFAEVKTYHNLGFLQGNIWYSKDPFFAGDTIRVYSAVYNSSAHDLVGTVEFLDGAALLGSVPFSVQGGGRMKDVWIDWKVAKGDHKITARIVNAKLAVIGGTEELIAVASKESGESVRFADTDTDRDGVGDREDTDDDNDTLADIEEIKYGMNQYQKDTDKDGITDDREIAALVAAKNTAAAATSSADTIAENPVVQTAVAALAVAQSTVDRAADAAAKKVTALRQEVASDIESTGGISPLTTQNVLSKPDAVFQKPLEYGYFLALSLAAFILGNKMLLYAVLALIALKLIHSVFRRLFAR